MPELVQILPWLLPLLLACLAALYAAVGHAGASGYLALFGLVGLAPNAMKPAALCLNILVAGIASIHYLRAGRFNASLFLPFAAASIPAALLGGSVALPGTFYRPLVGLVLVYAAIRLVLASRSRALPIDPAPKTSASQPDLWLIFSLGLLIGFLSGLLGVGGGIFLSPLFLLLRWEEPAKVSGIAALFVLVNSVAGLLGFGLRHGLVDLPPALPLWAIAVAIGGHLGARLGSRTLAAPWIRRLLAVVLLLAASKLILLPG